MLVVLIIISMLSFLIITSMMVAMQDVETVASRQIVLRARMLAETGLNIGAHPALKSGDPLLSRRISANESYEAVITTEEGRLNINSMLTEERRAILERVFVSWGLKLPDAQGVVDCLMDWTDADDFKRLKGAEKADYLKEGYPGKPFNRPFRSLDEMLLVRGMERVEEANPRWRDSFTLWGSGQLDINEAFPELIAAVANVPVSSTRALNSARNGPDGIAHTTDDEPLKNIDEAMALLGIKAADGAGLFTLVGTTRRVDSLGRVGNYARRLSVILQNNSDGPSIMDWRESADH